MKLAAFSLDMKGELPSLAGVVTPWSPSVGLNRQVLLGGRSIRGPQRLASGGLNLGRRGWSGGQSC